MLKIACLFSFKESNWVSCQKIVFNLHKSYQACEGISLENFNYSADMEALEEMEELAKKIVQYGPDIISVMDHKPHPLPLFQSLRRLLEGKKKPKIIFHVFGDFTLYYPQWAKMEPLLENFPVEFLVASERQKNLLDKMLLSHASIVCPFPVDPKEFYPKQELRAKQRQEWQAKDEDVIFIFTGRLSRQKRIKTLLKVFAQEFAQESRARLYIYGQPDHIGDPFVGINDIEGEYFRIFYKFYKSLAPEIQQRIHFMGAVPNAQLLQVYQGADVLINLSVHNDEDYGMSVAEAQSVGLNCVMTDWGGLASFAHPSLPEAVKFVPVKIGKYSKLISSQMARKAIRGFFERPGRELRAAVAQAAAEKFGLERSKNIIQETLIRPGQLFAGFSPLLHHASRANVVSQTDPVYLDERRMINKLYRDIYSSYVRNH